MSDEDIDKSVLNKGSNPLTKQMGWGGTHSEPWGVKALMIIDNWSRGPKATFFFFEG